VKRQQAELSATPQAIDACNAPTLLFGGKRPAIPRSFLLILTVPRTAGISQLTDQGTSQDDS
jgi:hypothetical protein